MSSVFDKELDLQEVKSNRSLEVERVLKCHDLDYISILQLDPTDLSDDSIKTNAKKNYRKKSVMIHPDKVDHSKAPQAFEKLKKAEKVMSIDMETSQQDETLRNLVAEKQRLIDIYRDVSVRQIQKDKTGNDASGIEELRREVAEILDVEVKQLEIEVKFQQRQEAKKQEEMSRVSKERELKKNVDAKWEDERDQRVDNWRKFTNKVEKKKSKKKKSKAELLA